MQTLSEEERKELDEMLDDPKKSEEWANKVIDSWIARRRAMREISKKSRKSSKTSKEHTDSQNTASHKA